MAVKVGEAYYDITARVDKLEAELAKASKTLDSHESKTKGTIGNLKTQWLALAGTVALLVVEIRKCVLAAADMQATVRKFESSFGDQIQIASASVADLAANYAMSDDEAKKLLLTVNNLLKGFGLSAKTSALYSDEIVKLAADMAAFAGVPVAETLQDIQSAFAGNERGLRQYGVVINDTMVEEEARRLGLTRLGFELSQASRMQATYSLLLQKTGQQQGYLAKNTDSLYVAQKKFNVAIEEAREVFGVAAQSGYIKLLDAITKIISKSDILKDTLQSIGDIVGKVFNQLAIEVLDLNHIITQLNLAWVQTKAFFEYGWNFKNIEELNRLLYEAQKQLGWPQEKIDRLKEIQKAFLGNEEAARWLKNAIEGVDEESTKAIKSAKKLGDTLKDGAEKIKGASKTSAEEIKKIRDELDYVNETYNQNEFERIDSRKNYAIRQLQDQLNKELILRSQYEAAVARLDDQAAKDQLQTLSQWVNLFANYATELASGVGNYLNAVTQQQANQLTEQTDIINQLFEASHDAAMRAAGFAEDTEQAKNEKNLERLKEALKLETDTKKQQALKAQITEKENLAKKYEMETDYENRKMVFDFLMEQKRKQLARKAAADQKALAIFTATVNTFAASIAAFASGAQINWIVGIVAGAAALAFGLAQVAMIAAAPLPAGREGLVTNRPAIIGEAGLEMAVPLQSTEGRKAQRSFASAMIDEINERNYVGAGGFITPVTGAGGQTFYVVVNVGNEKLYSGIHKASKDGLIHIDARALPNK